MSPFLAEEFTDELTGISKGKDGLTKHQLQCAWLKRQGIAFFQNARGRPVIVQSTLEGKKDKVQTGWTPKVVQGV